MATALTKRYTPEEYLALERKARDKHEFFEGEIFAMAGATKEHVRIAGNIYYRLRAQLEGKPCEPFNSDLRVKVSATGLYTYPDVSVACAPLEFEDKELDTLVNPRVICEVLSPTTKRRDHTFKFRNYRRIASMTEIVFVAQDAPIVEHFIRQPGKLWAFDLLEGLEAMLLLESIDCRLSLAQIYQDVEFPPDSPLA
jgi:Uma2 family endonuclease